jgi:DNA-binding transcriptional regulator YdaS (Cro superfamily)
MVMKNEQRSDGLRLAIEAAGSVSALARALGLSQQALWEWRRVPSHRILQVEAITNVPREKLRPDLYRLPALLFDAEQSGNSKRPGKARRAKWT